MRSRYVAYATGAVSYVMATTSPDSPHVRADIGAWEEEILAWCQAVRFERLEVLESSQDGDAGQVRFFAHLRAGDRDVSFGEDSTFVRKGGRWLYVADRVTLESTASGE